MWGQVTLHQDQQDQGARAVRGEATQRQDESKNAAGSGGLGSDCLPFCPSQLRWSVAPSRVAPRDSLDCSTPAFLVLHHLLEFAQTRVH